MDFAALPNSLLEMPPKNQDEQRWLQAKEDLDALEVKVESLREKITKIEMKVTASLVVQGINMALIMFILSRLFDKK